MKKSFQRILFFVCFFLVFFYSGFALAKTPKLLNHLVGDISQTVASWPAVVLAGGSVAALALTQADQSIQNSFRTGRHLGSADTVFRIMGAPYIVDSLAALTFGVGALSHNEETTRTGETLLETLGFSESATLGLKLAFNRKRPNGGNHGFPSGHASRTFAVATVLETLHGPLVGIPSYLLAGLISFSRLDENAHNLSDLVFGAALGSAVGWGTAHFHKKGDTNLLVLPMINNGVGGILVSSIF